MAKMKISSSGGDFQDPSAGNFPGACVRVIDLGTQEEEWEGKKSSRRKLMLGFELHGEAVDSDASGYMLGENGQPDPFKPFLVSAWLTASFNEEATLRKYMESWRGVPYTDEQIAAFENEGFDWNLMLGVPCMVKMGLNKKGKVKIQSVDKLQKNIQPPRPINATLAFVLDEFDPDVFAKIPDGIKDIIRKSPEWKALNGGAATVRSAGVESPFDEPGPDIGDGENMPF